MYILYVYNSNPLQINHKGDKNPVITVKITREATQPLVLEEPLLPISSSPRREPISNKSNN